MKRVFKTKVLLPAAGMLILAMLTGVLLLNQPQSSPVVPAHSTVYRPDASSRSAQVIERDDYVCLSDSGDTPSETGDTPKNMPYRPNAGKGWSDLKK